MEDLERDPMLNRLWNMIPGTEITEDVYMALKTRMRPLPLPDSVRMKSTQGITEGFLFGRAYCSGPEGNLFLAFGLSRRRGVNYYYLGQSTMYGENKRMDYKKAMRDPGFLMQMMRRSH